MIATTWRPSSCSCRHFCCCCQWMESHCCRYSDGGRSQRILPLISLLWKCRNVSKGKLLHVLQCLAVCYSSTATSTKFFFNKIFPQHELWNNRITTMFSFTLPGWCQQTWRRLGTCCHYAFVVLRWDFCGWVCVVVSWIDAPQQVMPRKIWIFVDPLIHLMKSEHVFDSSSD